MAETGERAGMGWLWLLIALAILIGAFLLSIAFLFPEGVELSQQEQTVATEQFIPVDEEAIAVELDEVLDDPSKFYGKDVVAIVRVNDILGNRALWVSYREDASQEFFAVIARGIDLRATDFRNYQIIQVFGTVRPIHEEELKIQGLEIGPRTSSLLSREKGYLLIKGLIPMHPQPWKEVVDEQEALSPTDEELATDEDVSTDEVITTDEAAPAEDEEEVVKLPGLYAP